MHRSEEASLRITARIAGVFYLVTFVAGVIALLPVRGRLIANLIATVSYIAVTGLFYVLFRPVSRSLSLLAAFVSFMGLVVGVLNMYRLAPFDVSPLVFFGFYCLLIGYLILPSTFLPRWLGVLMMFGGLGWLTFVSPPLVRRLAPYNFVPGIFAEGVLTVWLLAFGVAARRGVQPTGAAGRTSPPEAG